MHDCTLRSFPEGIDQRARLVLGRIHDDLALPVLELRKIAAGDALELEADDARLVLHSPFAPNEIGPITVSKVVLRRKPASVSSSNDLVAVTARARICPAA